MANIEVLLRRYIIRYFKTALLGESDRIKTAIFPLRGEVSQHTATVRALR